VQVGPHERQRRARAPVPEQSVLDVVDRQLLAQQRVVAQIDHPDREVVAGAPPRVELVELVAAEDFLRVLGLLHRCSSFGGTPNPASPAQAIATNAATANTRATPTVNARRKASSNCCSIPSGSSFAPVLADWLTAARQARVISRSFSKLRPVDASRAA